MLKKQYFCYLINVRSGCSGISSSSFSHPIGLDKTFSFCGGGDVSFSFMKLLLGLFLLFRTHQLFVLRKCPQP